MQILLQGGKVPVDKAWSWSETCFGITVSPTNSNKVLFGSYSNVESTTDGGTTWKQLMLIVQTSILQERQLPRSNHIRALDLKIPVAGR